jgi:hypothetical protein
VPTQLNSQAHQPIPPQADVEAAAPGDLARATYRELRQAGLSDTDIMAFAGELLSLVATDVRAQTAAE